MKWIVLILTLIYLVSPVDLLPGPVDDALVTVAATGMVAVAAMFGPAEPEGSDKR